MRDVTEFINSAFHSPQGKVALVNEREDMFQTLIDQLLMEREVKGPIINLDPWNTTNSRM